MAPTFVGLQILGITASSVFAGASAAQSILVIPSLMLAHPPLFARQFSNLVEATARIARPLSACTSVTLASLTCMSWASSSSSFRDTAGRMHQWHLLALATVVCFGITPFSAMKILPINRRMKELADKIEKRGMGEVLRKSEEDEIDRLVRRWRKYNYVRCSFPLLGSMIALWASLA